MPPIARPTTTYFQERGTRDGSGRVDQFGMGANSMVRPMWCPWVDRYKIARAIIGYSKLAKENVGDPTEITGLRRLTPLPHPDIDIADPDDGPGNMFASRINSIKGFKPLPGELSEHDEDINADTKKNVYSRAEIEVQYENIGYQIREDDDVPDWPENEWYRYLEILEPTPSSSYITLPGGTLNYIKSGGGGPTGLPINFNVGKIFSTMQFKFLWKRLPFDLFDPTNQSKWAKRIWGDPSDPTAAKLIGTVNKTSILGFLPGTLLLENVRPIPVRSPFYFIWEWDFEFTLNYNPNFWNYLYYFPVSTAGVTDRGFYLVGSGTTFHANGSVPDNYSLYNEAEHNLLFDVRDNP